MSDSIGLTGLAPGEYTIYGKMKLFVGDDGYIRDAGGRLCGSSKPVLYGMKNLFQQLHIPMERIIEMASLNPAKKLGVDYHKGSISIGKDADIVVINSNFDCLATYINGEAIFLA